MTDVTGTITTIDAVLKDNQTAKQVTRQFDQTSAIYDKLSKGMGGFWGDTDSGRRYIQPIEVEPAQAYTRYTSDSRGPSGEKKRLQAIYNPLSYVNSAIKFDLNVLARADGTGPSQAFDNELTNRIAGAVEAISAEVARQLFMASGDGTLGGCAVTAANQITLNAAQIEKLIKRNVLTENLKIDLWPATAGVPTASAAPTATELIITAINRTTGVITLTTAAGGSPGLTTVADGLRAVAIYGNRTWDGSTNGQRELSSLAMLCDQTGATAFGGLTSSNSGRWVGNQYNFSSTSFTVAKYMAALELVDATGGVGRNTYTFADKTRFNGALLALTTNLIGTQGQSSIAYGATGQVEAGFRKEIPLQDGTTLVQERFCAPGIIYSLDVDHLQLLDIDGEKIRWAGATGTSSGPTAGSMLLWDGNFSYSGMAYFNGDLVTDKRNSHVQMYNVA